MMKKLRNLFFSLTLIASLFTPISIRAESNEDLKESLLNSIAFTSMDCFVSIKEVETSLSYFEVKEQVKDNLISIISQINNGARIYWNSKFILTVVRLQLPELYDSMYNQLLAQGYDPIKKIDAKDSMVGQVTRGSSYSKTFTQELYQSGGVLALQAKPFIAWTVIDEGVTNKGYSITTASAGSGSKGWQVWLNRTAFKYENNTDNANATYNYSVNKDAYSYNAYLQFQVYPKDGGNTIEYVLSSGINFIGIGS